MVVFVELRGHLLSMRVKTNIVTMYPMMNRSSTIEATAPGPIGMLVRKATVLNVEARAEGILRQENLPVCP